MARWVAMRSHVPLSRRAKHETCSAAADDGRRRIDGTNRPHCDCELPSASPFAGPAARRRRIARFDLRLILARVRGEDKSVRTICRVRLWFGTVQTATYLPGGRKREHHVQAGAGSNGKVLRITSVRLLIEQLTGDVLQPARHERSSACPQSELKGKSVGQPEYRSDAERVPSHTRFHPMRFLTANARKTIAVTIGRPSNATKLAGLRVATTESAAPIPDAPSVATSLLRQ